MQRKFTREQLWKRAIWPATMSNKRESVGSALKHFTKNAWNTTTESYGRVFTRSYLKRRGNDYGRTRNM